MTLCFKSFTHFSYCPSPSNRLCYPRKTVPSLSTRPLANSDECLLRSRRRSREPERSSRPVRNSSDNSRLPSQSHVNVLDRPGDLRPTFNFTMRIPLAKRGILTCINIIFPPLGVMLLCGPETDLIMNCILFLFAIIPSHVHAFYISCTYFNRKKKVRKGIYPGTWRQGIYSERVQNGGASWKEIERLRAIQEGKLSPDDGLTPTSSRSRSRSRKSGYLRGTGSPVQQAPVTSRGGLRKSSGYQDGVRSMPSRHRTTHWGYAESPLTPSSPKYANSDFNNEGLQSRGRTGYTGSEMSQVQSRANRRRSYY